jgi:hypothetical protein
MNRRSEIVSEGELFAAFRSKFEISMLESQVRERRNQRNWKALASPLPRPWLGIMSTGSDTISFSP